VNIASIVGGFATVGAFIYAGLALRQVKYSDQVKMVNEILDSLSQIESEIPALVENPEQYNLKLNLWLVRYFNKYEWLSQLVNTNVIKDKTLQESFKNSLITDYENMFQKYATDKQKTDVNTFPHFKKLYNKWKCANITTD
jgi:hypothetical protein